MFDDEVDNDDERRRRGEQKSNLLPNKFLSDLIHLNMMITIY
jgi:hypothetical protein